MKYLTALAIGLLFWSAVNALAVSFQIPFPAPPFTAEQAIQKASAYYAALKGDQESIIVSVKFGNPAALYPAESGYLDVAEKNEWCWFITYANPRTGSTSVYQLENTGKIHLLGHLQT